jgi:hypothetical protein
MGAGALSALDGPNRRDALTRGRIPTPRQHNDPNVPAGAPPKVPGTPHPAAFQPSRTTRTVFSVRSAAPRSIPPPSITSRMNSIVSVSMRSPGRTLGIPGG